MSEPNVKEMSEIQDKEEVGQDMSEAREDVVVETKIVQDDETQVGEEATVAREDDGGEEAAEEAEEEKVGSEGTEAKNEGGEPEMEGGEPEKEGGDPEKEGGEPEKEGDEPEKEGDEPEKEWGEPEKEGTPPPSENPSESIEVDEKDPQVPSEAVASEPTAAVEPPPEPCLTNQTSQIEEKSQDKNDNAEEQIAVDEPENATASEENMDTDIKEENMDTDIKEENADTDVKEENMDTDIKKENGNETVQRDGIIDADIMQSKENFAQAVSFKQDNTREETQVNAIQSFSFDAHVGDGDESGTEEEQAAFMRELENFFRERNLEFKPPKFYGEGLNCLKLWRAVTRLGGYDQVTSCKLWRQVGESFNPPKTCTTVSWSFRCFYEKALLEYERHKVRGGELRVTPSPLSDPVGVDNPVGGSQASGSGRARRDAAARAMQGWHSQRLLGNGEDKSSVALPKREKQIKSLSLLKRKKPSTLERAVKVARSKGANPRDVQGSQAVRMDTMVADIGPAADWVKINVRRTKDCYEVYALVPGLLREEVRVQSDASGRLVISGDPEQPDNPWGVTPFKKVISLPSRIDAHQTSAVVTLHGQLFVRAPFEPSDL